MRTLCTTAKLLQQGYRYHKLRKTCSKFYRRHYELISKFNVGLKTLLHVSFSEPDFFFYFFLYCYERDVMDSLIHDNQADVIEAFNSTSRYLDDLSNIDNPYFEGTVKNLPPPHTPELKLNKANNTDTEATFVDLHLSIANRFVSSKIFDKHDDFDFDIVNFPFLDGDVPRRASYHTGHTAVTSMREINV